MKRNGSLEKRCDRKLFFDFSYNFFGNIIVFILSFFISIIIARLLGPEKKGVYSLILFLPGLMTMIFGFGLDASTIYHYGKKEISLSDLIAHNNFLVIILSFLAILSGCIVIFLGYNTYFVNIDRGYLFLALALIPLGLYSSMLKAVLRAKDEFKKLNIANFLSTLVLGLFVLLLFLRASVGLLVFIQIGALFAGIIVLIEMTKGSVHFSFKREPVFIRKSLLYGVKVHFSNIISYFHYRVDLIIINMLMTPLFVGYYSLAVNIAEKAWMLSQSISSVLFSRITKEDNGDDQNSTVRISLFITFWGTISLLFVLTFWGGFLIPMIYGNDYLPSYPLIKLLAPGIIMLSISRILSADLAARGYPQKTIIPKLTMLLLNIVLNLLFIPKYGIGGAAMATSITYTMSSVMIIVIHRKISSSDFFRFFYLSRNDIRKLKRILKKGDGE